MREYSQHLSGAHSSIPLFCTSFPPIATASQGTIRVGSSENSMLRPFRRVGRVALRRSLPQQTRRFPRIDSRSIEASSAPTRRGAACARGRRLKAGTPLVLFASSVQWPRGEFKKTLGDRSRRRLQVSEITLRSQAGLCAISLAPLHKFGIEGNDAFRNSSNNQGDARS